MTSSAGAESRRSRARAAAKRERSGDQPPGDAEATPAPRPIAYSSLHVWMFAAAVGIAVWWAVLIWMVATTANPVTLNHRQIASSPHVVTATVLSAADGRLRVDKDWRLPTAAEIVVADLETAGAVDGETYIVPIDRDGLDLAVTGVLVPRVDEGDQARFHPRIYPATEAAIEQLRTLLAELAERKQNRED